MSETIKAADAVMPSRYWVSGESMICVMNDPAEDYVAFWRRGTGTHYTGKETKIIPLPDDAGYDYVLPPPEPDYAELHAKCGLKVGDRVRVTKRTEPKGWGAGWNSPMEEAIGKIGKITLDRESLGFRVRAFADGYPWYFPCTSLEKIEPQYRPFASAAEFEPHEGRRWRYVTDPSSQRRMPASYSDQTHSCHGWCSSFKQKVFCDGSPFGVEVTK